LQLVDLVRVEDDSRPKILLMEQTPCVVSCLFVLRPQHIRSSLVAGIGSIKKEEKRESSDLILCVAFRQGLRTKYILQYPRQRFLITLVTRKTGLFVGSLDIVAIGKLEWLQKTFHKLSLHQRKETVLVVHGGQDFDLGVCWEQHVDDEMQAQSVVGL